MLNPPLSLLSDDLIGHLVEHVARLSFVNEALKKLITVSLTGSNPADHLARLSGSFVDETLHNLSLADRAFTKFCQKYIFRTLALGREEGTRSRISKKLTQVKRILDDKPIFANRVRKIQLFIEHRENAWLFQSNGRNHPRRKDAAYAITFMSILQLLATSPMLAHELHFATGLYPIEDPVLVVGQLSQSFFSQSLMILHLIVCENIPLPLFLICPRLKELRLDRVEAAEEGYEAYNKYPDDQCSGRESPALEVFNYRASHTVVQQMITPPPRFHTPVVLWSNLRVLTLSPHERETMVLLRPILDAACTTLEELYLTNLYVGPDEQLPLAGHVNLSELSCLRVFALYAFIKCDTPGSAVLRDINIVLGTIPASNSVTNLFFFFTILGTHPFGGCLDEDWVGLCDKLIRISSGKPLELDLEMAVDNGTLEGGHGEDELYVHVMDKTTSLSDHPKICTHFWNPTYWTHGLGPFPRGQARSRCRR